MDKQVEVTETNILTDEQIKRIELIEAYEKETAPDREARNEALAEHDKEFDTKWMAMRSEMELKRAETIDRLRSEGRTEDQIGSIVAAEMAAMAERHMVEKDAAARKLDLAMPKSWLDWLQEKKQLHPEDKTIDSLIEEAKRSEPALDGYLRTPPPNAVVTELVPNPTGDGKVDYMRGMMLAVTDTGARLDVRRMDDRDIEAALKIAAQKFDMDKGLMLTGDLAFKRRAAEIAGRLGYRIQNTEPEVLQCHKRGQEQQPKPILARIPMIANGIEGETLDRAVAALNGPMTLRADPHTLKTLESKLVPGIEATTSETIVLPGDRVWRANAEMRELPVDVLPILAQVDISKDDGGLNAEQIAKLAKENQGLVEDGKITNKLIEIVLVRDDRVMRTRDDLPAEMKQIFGPAYRTTGDVIRARSTQEVEKQGQSLEAEAQQEEKKLEPELPDIEKFREKSGLPPLPRKREPELER